MDSITTLVETILDSTNSMLAENQRILSPLFNPNPDIRSIGNNFGDLYNNQRHRGDFGKWLSYLKILQEKESDSKVREQMERLHAVLYELHRSFYKAPEQREINHLVGEHKGKILLIDYINARIPVQQMRTATQEYLDFLRDSIEQIGDIAGVLRALDVTTQPATTLSPRWAEKEHEPSKLSLDSKVDFVLVTALPEERDAVLEKLPGYRQLPPVHDDIRTYYQVDLPITFSDSSTGQYRMVVMCLLGMGRVQAATATADAIRRWRPRYILLIGIAGGIAARNVQIGDILISDQIVDYELQKLTPQGPEVRWEVHHTDPRLLDASNNYRSAGWQESIRIKRPGKGKPTRHAGPIASGDKVIAFDEVLARYRDVWPKLIGVEMEAAGVATAAFQSSDKPGFFMVRGVSDLADENKGSGDVKKWRAYACDVAASFAIAFLKSGPAPLLGLVQDEKIREVLSACYRRAIFTRTHAQLSMEAMFTSLTQCRTTLQQLVTSIESKEMHYQVVAIIGELDNIERHQQDHQFIDSAKLRIIHSLLKLSKVTKVPYEIPTHLTEEIFFTEDEANRAPRGD